ncbi:hypothetical protein P3L10_004351 [Capsicum annuum]
MEKGDCKLGNKFELMFGEPGGQVTSLIGSPPGQENGDSYLVREIQLDGDIDATEAWKPWQCSIFFASNGTTMNQSLNFLLLFWLVTASFGLGFMLICSHTLKSRERFTEQEGALTFEFEILGDGNLGIPLKVTKHMLHISYWSAEIVFLK